MELTQEEKKEFSYAVNKRLAAGNIIICRSGDVMRAETARDAEILVVHNDGTTYKLEVSEGGGEGAGRS